MRSLLELSVDPEIEQARSLPGWVYTDPEVFEAQRARVFRRSWQADPTPSSGASSPRVEPWTLLPGCLDEPLLWTRADDDRLRCLSNVCTHRGARLVDAPTTAATLRCPYHGRRFDLRGAMVAAPGFEGCPGFPTPDDDLPEVPSGRAFELRFASLGPAHAWDEWMGPVLQRVGPLVRAPMTWSAVHTRHYEVPANWASYCDNYLEGLHIRFVHPSLQRGLDPRGYRIELLPAGVLQVGVAAPEELAFELPEGHPDRGTPIAAYYYWLFPNTMINVYPWGLSINLVRPRGPAHTEVTFLRAIWDPSTHGVGAGADLDRVEREDEAIVQRTFEGMHAHLYRAGRYAPSHEAGVHHFHRLLCAAMGRP